ncbi:MAG: hypothetical protein M3458_05925 [Acidobacteriota bacterium]|nr:hypothetical protein [Acidobacteriota bacterium]
MRATPKNRHLFETTRYTSFTTRRVQQVVKQYRGGSDSRKTLSGLARMSE